MENMKEKVCEVLVSVNDRIKSHLEETQLVTGGILDSLDIMNLIMELESAFDIEIDPEDVLSDNFESVDTIIALIKKCQV